MKNHFKTEKQANNFAKTVNNPIIYMDCPESMGMSAWSIWPWCVEYDSIKMKKVYRNGNVQMVPISDKYNYGE